MIKQEVNPLIARSIMRPTEVNYKPYVSAKWLEQPKLNGVFARWDPATRSFYSKRGIKFREHLIPHLYEAHQGINLPLDGELWSPALTLQQITGALSHERNEPADYAIMLKYCVFDAPDYTHTKNYLARVAQIPLGVVRINEERFESLRDPLVDGTIYRYLPGTYERGPSANVLKLKSWKDIEVRVIGYLAGTPGSLNHGALGALVCVHPNGEQFSVGSGFTQEERLEFVEKQPDYIKVRYLALSPDGVPLNPSYLGLDL